VIGTLLDLQLVGMTDEHAKEIMTESSTRVRSISLIHQQLYQENNISSIEFSKFAADLMNQITSVLSKTGQNIVLHNELTETVLDVDTAVPLGLMLNELITNSYKYAFGGANQGSITIALKNMNGSYQLVYKDSGPGMPADYNIKKSGSLGMKLLHSLSKQIGGRFTYHETGKFFTITFTDETGRKLID
jgi:two-component sensor histidine kinase